MKITLDLFAENVGFNKKLVRPLWYMIFISTWYLVNIKKKVKTNGNFFDIISMKV